jgi:Heme/copper-type cytochrome/quinol oxidases, subunit 1
MTILNEPPVTGATTAPPAAPPRKQSLGKAVVNWTTSTDHKLIGYMYLVTSMVWFFIAGAMALAIRAELALPGLQIISLEQYNQLFTMHGTIMLFLFATPLFVGFGNVIVPLQITAPPTSSFPR